jgi:hypothetical protein
MVRGASAASITATIQTLHVNLDSGLAHVQFVGLPVMNGLPSGTCSSQWTANLLTDDLFMKYVWPLLMMAKASGQQVIVNTNGCTNGYPKIAAIDVEPRTG